MTNNDVTATDHCVSSDAHLIGFRK
jgi:hypothetical protein